MATLDDQTTGAPPDSRPPHPGDQPRTEITHWDSKYREGITPWDTGQPSTELLRVFAQEKITPCTAIDLGCGTGTNALWLAQQGLEVTGVDLSPLAVARARERCRAAGVTVRILQGDLLVPPELGGPFDFFLDRGCYHAVRRLDGLGYLQTLSRITHSGSRGLVLAGNAREPHEPGPPVMTEEQLRTELGTLFTIVWLREFYFDLSAGDTMRHLGWSCLVRRP